MTRRLVLLVGIAASAAACGAARAPEYYLPDGHTVNESVSKLPPSGQNITVTELQRSENSSVSAVQVRDREEPHVHTRYDLTVVVASGEGTLWLNGLPIRMQRGDAVFIPKGTPHYFVNDGSDPAVAIVVFSPPFTGRDQAPVP